MADDRVQQLEETVQGLTQRVYRLEGQVFASWRVPAAAPAPAASPAGPPRVGPAGPSLPAQPPAGWTAGPPVRPTGPRAPHFEISASRLLAVAGGVALLLGVGYLLRYAAAQGWLGPGVRVLLALAGSATLARFGLRIERQVSTRVVGQICTAIAAAGAYAAVVAASVNYGLVSPVVGLVGAAAVAGSLVVRGVTSRSQVVAALGIVGALTAPAFVDQAPDLLGLAFLVLALVAGVAVALYGRWAAVTGVVFVVAWPQIASIASSRGPENVALWLTAIAATAFLVGGLGHARGHGWDKAIGPLLLVAVNGFFVAALGWFVLADFNIFESLTVHPDASLWLFGVAAVHLSVAAVMSRRLFNPPAAVVTAIVGLVAADSALLDLTDGYAVAVILTVSALLAAVATAVPWLRDAARAAVLIQFGLVVLHGLVVVIHLAPTGSVEAVVMVAAVCAVAVLAAPLLRRSSPELAAVAMAALGSLAVARLLTDEAPPIALFFGTEHLAAAFLMCVLIAAAAWAASAILHRAFLFGAVVVANYALSLAAVAMEPDGIGRVALTALWAAGGGAALVAGRTRDRTDLRRGGAALLTAAVTKAALVDTATLSGTNRVAALLLCGSVLVATAVAEARAPRTHTPAI